MSADAYCNVGVAGCDEDPSPGSAGILGGSIESSLTMDDERLVSTVSLPLETRTCGVEDPVEDWRSW